jgi:Flp pilus assembly protein CpaB
MKNVLAGMIMALVLVPCMSALAQQASTNEKVLPMPAHSEFERFSEGQVFVRVTPSAEGAILAATFLGVELIASDTVAYQYTDPRLFNEEAAPDVLTGFDATLVAELRKVVSAGMSSIRLTAADLRRYERMEAPLVITVALRKR